MAPNTKHKGLADSFAPPERGSKLQGLLNAPARSSAAAAETTPDIEAADGDATVDAAQVAQQSAPVVEANASTPATAEKSAPARRTRVGDRRGVSASSVYLTADTYKQLTIAKSRKIKDYSQIVQDAFAQVAREAADQKKSPEEVLAALFVVPEDGDSWLMPSSTSRSKSATPLTEARISFSTQQRAWIEEKMAVVNRTVTFSEFVARILDHHLLPSKRR